MHEYHDELRVYLYDKSIETGQEANDLLMKLMNMPEEKMVNLVQKDCRAKYQARYQGYKQRYETEQEKGTKAGEKVQEIQEKYGPEAIAQMSFVEVDEAIDEIKGILDGNLIRKPEIREIMEMLKEKKNDMLNDKNVLHFSLSEVGTNRDNESMSQELKQLIKRYGIYKPERSPLSHRGAYDIIEGMIVDKNGNLIAEFDVDSHSMPWYRDFKRSND